MINSPNPQKCSEMLPSEVKVISVEDEENDVCTNLPSIESVIPTSSRFDSACADGITGISRIAKTNAMVFLISYANQRCPINGSE